MRDKVLAVLETYSAGGTLKAALKAHALHPHSFYTFLDDNPEIMAKHQAIKRHRADMMVDEAYEIGTDENAEPRRARVQIDSRIKIAGFYDRQQFGEKIDLTVHNHVDLSAALLEARNRALPQPLRNLENVQDAEFVALPGAIDSGTADKQSAAPKPLAQPGADISEE